MKEKKIVPSASVVPICHYTSVFSSKWRLHLCLSRHWIQAGDSSLTQEFSFCNGPRDYLKGFLAGNPLDLIPGTVWKLVEQQCYTVTLYYIYLTWEGGLPISLK